MLVRQRTQILNSLRGHLAEIGIIAAQSPVHGRALAGLSREGDASIPPAVAAALLPLVTQLEQLDAEITLADIAIAKLAKADPLASALKSIPGIGPITASALVASVGDASGFSGPRQFAAFLGLVPRQNSSGGKVRLGRVSKMGNAYLRKLLVVGAHAVLYHRARHTDPLRCWADKLMATKPFKLVAVALANKLARIVYAVMTTGTSYRNAAA
jgi:transposase